MGRFLFGVFLIAVFAPLHGRGAQPQSNGGDSLPSFLVRRGFTRTPLKRLPRNGLGLSATINQKSGALLLLASACPISGIDRGSVVKVGLVPQKTNIRVNGT